MVRKLGCINRDYNACLNMKKITSDLITGKGKPVSYNRCSKKSIALLEIKEI